MDGSPYCEHQTALVKCTGVGDSLQAEEELGVLEISLQTVDPWVLAEVEEQGKMRGD